MMTNLVQFPRLGLELEIDRVAFTLGNMNIYWYGIIIAAGLLLALVFAFHYAADFGVDADRLVDVVLVGTVCAIICARAYYVAFAPFKYDSIWDMINLRDGGIAIYGAVIGAAVFGGLACKWRKVPILPLFDLVGICFLIGQGIGRWANFVNQEAFGTNTDLPWGMISSATQEIVPDRQVQTCFLYESIWCLVGFALLHVFTRKLRRYDGQAFLLYLLWYGLGRFFIEGLRQDSLIIPGTSLRVSQVVALTSVVAAVVLLIVFRSKTSLSGCGAKDVVAMNAVVDEVPDVKAKEEEEDDGKSTIFGDLPYEQLITETGAVVSGESKQEEKRETLPAQDSEAAAQEVESSPSDAKTDEAGEKEEKADGKAD